jgi:hypothetical protein
MTFGGRVGPANSNGYTECPPRKVGTLSSEMYRVCMACAMARGFMVCRPADYCRKNSICNIYPSRIGRSVVKCILVTFGRVLVGGKRYDPQLCGRVVHRTTKIVAPAFTCIGVLENYSQCTCAIYPLFLASRWVSDPRIKFFDYLASRSNSIHCRT